MRRAGTDAARLAARKVALGLALAAQISFVKDATGSVTSLIFHNPGGKNIPGNRIK